jgi:hypothetical protein
VGDEELWLELALEKGWAKSVEVSFLFVVYYIMVRFMG